VQQISSKRMLRKERTIPESFLLVSNEMLC
jgi:hypothetical protein